VNDKLDDYIDAGQEAIARTLYRNTSGSSVPWEELAEWKQRTWLAEADDYIDALAAEAEKGYDVDELLRKRRSRADGDASGTSR
jgi:hypothetical protein